jgi:hypothetical protein
MRNNKFKQQSSLKNLFLFLPCTTVHLSSCFSIFFFKWRDFFKERKRKKERKEERKKERDALLGWLTGSFAPCWGPPLVMGPGIIITIEKKRNPVGGHTPRHGQFPLNEANRKNINMNLLCQFPVQID